ncbi:MAG: sporulation protein Cse60 [Bacilli bacterium]|nr:sporulation protein Cse60 [Bacilli bacterium]
MLVKVFDESHEKDLESAINSFLSEIEDLFDIKYSVAITTNGEEQIYCFSALVIYRD